ELNTNSKEKQDGSNGNGISERTGYERTDETQMQGEGEQQVLGAEPNVKTEQKGAETAKTDTKDAEKKIINTDQKESTVKSETPKKDTEIKTDISDNQNKPIINDKTKSETVKPIKQKELPISKVFTKA